MIRWSEPRRLALLDLWAVWVAFAAMLVLGFAGWTLSLARRDVSIVDSLWSLFFLLGAVVYASVSGVTLRDHRAVMLLVLVALWALRLSAYIAARGHGAPEDRRYGAMRSKYGPSFKWTSLFIVFLLQATLAAIISAPLLVGLSEGPPIGVYDIIGVSLWVVGFGFETVGDWQLARFKSRPANAGRVLDTGLWRYTRHPNYFGEALLWWGFFFIAVAAGGLWTIFAPILMTWLLLKVSGVTLLERDIHERRPEYRDYIARTNAFIPWVPR